MAPDLVQQDQSEDLMMLTKHFEVLKLMDRDSGRATGTFANSEPTPDGHVSSNGNVLIRNNESNYNTPGGFFQGNDLKNANQPRNSEESEMNIKKNIMDNVKAFFKQPSLEVSVSSIINKDLLKYDVTERNAIYEEVHGVGNICPDESQPGMVENALREVACELKALPAHQMPYYTQSLNIPHSYIHSTNFRMKMLRAELFNPKRAAFRTEKCLEAMVELFGPATLERPPQLSDFSKREFKCLNSGRIQLLPFRDRGGRRVVVGIPSQKHNLHHPVTRAKIHFYLWWVASESVETQRNGMVMVTVHNPGIADANPSTATETAALSAFGDEEYEDIRGLPSLRFARIYVKCRRGMPTRLICLHTCTPDTPYYNIVRAYNSVMVEERARLKFHVGEDIENRYKLSGYGIPLDQLPITEGGKIKNMHFKKWLLLRKNIENFKFDQDQESIIECPNLNDVVFRPSQSTMCHPGNVMFRGLVESKHGEHSLAPTREAKIDVTRSVMTAVRQLGGRFLVWNNQTWWTEITDEKVIYSKIAVFFRNSKVSAKAKSNRQTTKSSTYIFADQDKRRRIDVRGSNNNHDGDVVDDETCFGFV
eukprot:CAMPEP_0116131312 /NCGR_PEP_ID=MMETSP0329-20121206/8939_1 /TAXON_ID=697910 /ORGANISM="Pseudo-nitzschia arenysensis, Strain B593" /LENGTH=591 /DNA_ID=CAMNT_0003625735 /DNA_START=421 /DNA_END=2196 /DNA_ORIENTATION=+